MTQAPEPPVPKPDTNGRDLIDVRGLDPSRLRPLDETQLELLRRVADKTLALCKPAAGRDLGYDVPSLEWIDGYLDRMRETGALAEAGQENVIKRFGAFLGEFMVAAYSGTWVEIDGSFAVALPDDFVAFPFTKVAKHVDKRFESIGSFATIPMDAIRHLRNPPPGPGAHRILVDRSGNVVKSERVARPGPMSSRDIPEH